MKKILASVIALLRIVGFVAMLFAAAYVAWKDIHNWGLMNKEHPQLPDNLTALTSVWGPAYTYLLSCIVFPIGAALSLKNPKDLSPMRLTMEVFYYALAFYTLAQMSLVIYFTYNPYHSGPAL